MKKRNKIWRVVIIVLSIFLVLALAFSILIQRPSFQTFVAKKLTTSLANKLGTKVSIESLDFTFVNNISIDGFYVEDKKGDTLVYVGKLYSKIELFKPFQNKFQLSQTKVNDVTFYVNKAEDANLNTLQEVFGSNSKTTAKKNKKALNLGFKDVTLSNIVFVSDDKAEQKRTTIILPEGRFDFKQFQLYKKNIAAKSIVLNDIYIDLFQASNGGPAPDSIAFFLPNNWTIKSNSLSIDNGRFANKTANKPNGREADFSFSDFDLDNLYLTAGNVELKNQVLNLNIKPLSFVDKTGFTIDQLIAKTRLAPDGLSLIELELKTPNSMAQGMVELGFLNLAHFSNFNEYIDLAIHFTEANIHPKTLDYFFARSPIDESISIQGNFKGQVANLQANNVYLKFRHGTKLRGNISAIGLPDLTNTFFDADIKELTTTPNGLKKIGRMSTIPEKIAKFTTLNYSGKFTGFTSDFVTYGDIHTNLGNIKADINYTAKKGNPSYSGSISTPNFALGNWLGEESLGNVSFSTQVNGTGFEPNTMSANFNGTVNSIEYNNNTISNLMTNGRFERNLLSGLLSINDNEISGDFDGTVNFTGARPYFDVEANLRKANLFALGLVKEPLRFESVLHADIKGTNIQDITGDIIAENLILTRAEGTSTFSALGAHLEDIDGQQVLNLNSENVSAKFTGNYDITQLLPTIKYTLNNYYDFKRGWEDKSNIIKSNEPIGFELDIKGNDDLTRFLFPELNFTSALIAQGELLPDNAEIDMTAKSDELKYGKYSLKDWDLVAKGDGTNLQIISAQNNIQDGSALWLDNSSIQLDMGRDNIIANVKSFNEEFLNADITGSITRNGDRFTVSISDSDVVINNESWIIAANNSITFGKNYWAAENFIIKNKEQEIQISNPIAEINTKLIADVSNIKLADLNQFISFTAKPFDGDLNGSVSLVQRDNTNNLDVSLTISNLMYNNDLAELADITGTYTPKTKKGRFEGFVIGSEYDFGLAANLNLNEGANLLDLNLEVYRASVSPFGNLWAKSIENTTGYLNGSLNIYGGPIEFNLAGDLTLDTDINTTLKFTQAKYSIAAGQKLRIVENAFLIDDLILADAYGNTANINGSIIHDNLKEFNLNVFAVTDKLLFLKTSPLDNSTFYGTAFAGGTIGFSGPVTNVLMNVDAFSREDTNITIKAGSSQNTSQYSFISFKKPLDTLSIEEKKSRKKAVPSKLTMNFNLAVDPEANMNLLFDDAGYNVVKGNGSSSNLNIIYDTDGRFEMTGVYTINSGSYAVNLNNVATREFQLLSGGQIQWSGNPYDARLNITGQYKTRADINDLLGTSSITSIGSTNTNTSVEVNIAGTIAAPDLSYRISVESSGQASELLRQINADPAQVEAQVATLLFAGTFKPIDANPFSAIESNVSDLAINTVTNIITRELGNLFTELNIVDDLDINFKNNSNPTDGGTISNTQTFGLNAEKRLFKGRVLVELGGDFNFGDLESADLNMISIGDFVVYVLLTDNGNARFKIFDRKDYLNYQINNQRRRGFGFFFKKEFNSFSDLFKKDKSKKQKLSEQRKQKKDDALKEEEQYRLKTIDKDDNPQ